MAPSAMAKRRQRRMPPRRRGCWTRVGRRLVGTSVFDVAQGWADAYRALFLTFGGNMRAMPTSCSQDWRWPRARSSGQTSRPSGLGPARRATAQDVGYFYFLQGESPEAIAADAAHAVSIGEPVIYLRVGVGTERGRDAVRLVRAAIGDARLRLDANEAWDVSTAIRRLTDFAPYGIEYIEQPTTSPSIEALRRVTERSPIAIAPIRQSSRWTKRCLPRLHQPGAADMVAIGPLIGRLRGTVKGSDDLLARKRRG
ncbi:MAG: enolase C-terminal domain-like protein [Defluviimonas denitrificans]